MKPLDGITVVELATYAAAPACGRILLEQGARVIKIESGKTGDVYRYIGRVFGDPITKDENPIYDIFNADKEDISLNLKDSADRNKFMALLKKADVLLTNYRHAALVKLGVDYETLKVKFPELIYARIVGYGEKGPKAEFPAFDTVAMFAECGFMQDMVVETEGTYPLYLPMAVGDLACGTMLAGAIGTALYGRSKTGHGDYVSVSIYGTGLWLFGFMSMSTQYGYKFPKTRYEGSPLGIPYKTKDNKWIFACINEYDRYWKPYCEAFGAYDLIDDPKFCTREATFIPENRKECIKRFEGYAARKTAEEIGEKLERGDIIYTVLKHFKDNHSSEQALLNGYLIRHTYPSGKEITMAMPGVYLKSAGKPSGFGRHHEIGEDNDAVFRDFGVG
jgi:crotonobetainyl-CoA:carnitine CoA-transferase CaiB-like acyl-CoA transferase